MGMIEFMDDVQLDSVARTGRLTAALRAAEAAQPDRLFTDPFAERLAGDVGNQLLAEFGYNAAIAVRTHYLDDELTALQPDQLVIVAAGMDSRTYRLDALAGAETYELDRPEVLRLKASLITEPPVGKRHDVGVDLTADWVPALRAAGFDPTRPTVWMAEGLTCYLIAEQVDRLTTSPPCRRRAAGC